MLTWRLVVVRKRCDELSHFGDKKLWRVLQNAGVSSRAHRSSRDIDGYMGVERYKSQDVAVLICIPSPSVRANHHIIKQKEMMKNIIVDVVSR